MPDYRFYKIDGDCHVVSFRIERTFDDDATAIACGTASLKNQVQNRVGDFLGR
jgi:hypothetical protein